MANRSLSVDQPWFEAITDTSSLGLCAVDRQKPFPELNIRAFVREFVHAHVNLAEFPWFCRLWHWHRATSGLSWWR